MTSSNRYSALFERLEQNNQGAFVPFVTLGDPDKATSLSIIRTLLDSGADALELGFPFSDPSADGPVIQGANLRALESGMKVQDCFDIIKTIRNDYKDAPIGLLVYANLVYRRGIKRFYQDCQEAGVDSVLIADVPVQESGEFAKVAKAYGINQIFIAPPNASNTTLMEVAQAGSGYTYLLSRAGVTGTDVKAGMPVMDQLQTLQEYNAPPAILGFGISEPDQVAQAIANGASGAIAGSATVKLIEQHLHDSKAMLSALAQFTKTMKQATHK
ncbi:tryptophan synthase subunit alpha [Paraferrimonas haliotis]|uniref:Tryptophan synthase alpha chain n=1 Tax=Paraferrimonas haliotis TaxID=2013866 RepID=A0AA37WYU1_9GAMM|nr:tryptophan synthase subunit alpha [Paraferrimonas haliotis]GLS84140.1 tryptophan synthase alpha chain [Paraferrimonas haliotis]